MTANGRRFQINPGPLKLRGKIPEPRDLSRCYAVVRDGSDSRCLRNMTGDGPFCVQHARMYPPGTATDKRAREALLRDLGESG